jgi:hypothetical protein
MLIKEIDCSMVVCYLTLTMDLELARVSRSFRSKIPLLPLFVDKLQYPNWQKEVIHERNLDVVGQD